MATTIKTSPKNFANRSFFLKTCARQRSLMTNDDDDSEINGCSPLRVFIRRDGRSCFTSDAEQQITFVTEHLPNYQQKNMDSGREPLRESIIGQKNISELSFKTITWQ